MRRGIVFVLVLLVAAACSKEEEPASAPSVADFEKERAALSARISSKRRQEAETARGPGQKAAPKPGESDDTEFAAVEKEYAYDATGKRDPFRSFILQANAKPDDARGPLEQFDLAQLSVQAVVWGTDRPRALVSDPSGRGYIVQEGTYMGKNEGRVIDIADNALVVKETYVDYFGETTTKDVTMRVRADQEGDLR